MNISAPWRLKGARSAILVYSSHKECLCPWSSGQPEKQCPLYRWDEEDSGPILARAIVSNLTEQVGK